MKGRRPAKTLIEMLILMSMLSVILGMVATTLIALFKTDRQIRRDLAQQATLARLDNRFRSDVHAAKSCQVGDACALALPDGRVVHYTPDGERLRREVRRGEAVEHRDAFVLPDTCAIRFQQPEEFSGRLVRLSIAAKEDSDKPFLTAVRPATIDAAIGLSAVTKEAAP
jgi:type II secretory pathway pseudopilin PulG